jgi:hypothetical protein
MHLYNAFKLFSLSDEMETKRDFENKPFWTIPPVEYSMLSTLDDYIDVILTQTGEDGGRKTFFSYLTGLRDYKHTRKNVQLRRIFTGFFESFEELKNRLKENGLEKTSGLIEMQAPDRNGFGLIEYQRAYGAWGEFATYRLLQRDALLQIINSDWRECLERK